MIERNRNPLDTGEVGRPDPAVAAIEFAIDIGPHECWDFLNMWFHGDFPEIRREWPETPEAVFIGADPLHKSETQS